MSNTTVVYRPIRGERDLDIAFARIDEIMDARAGTPERDELDLLSELVGAYEQRNHPINSPNPIDLLNSKLNDQAIALDQLKEVLPNVYSISSA